MLSFLQFLRTAVHAMLSFLQFLCTAVHAMLFTISLYGSSCNAFFLQFLCTAVHAMLFYNFCVREFVQCFLFWSPSLFFSFSFFS